LLVEETRVPGENHMIDVFLFWHHVILETQLYN
jgi:hypothetical protein